MNESTLVCWPACGNHHPQQEEEEEEEEEEEQPQQPQPQWRSRNNSRSSFFFSAVWFLWSFGNVGKRSHKRATDKSEICRRPKKSRQRDRQQHSHTHTHTRHTRRPIKPNAATTATPTPAFCQMHHYSVFAVLDPLLQSRPSFFLLKPNLNTLL